MNRADWVAVTWVGFIIFAIAGTIMSGAFGSFIAHQHGIDMTAGTFAGMGVWAVVIGLGLVLMGSYQLRGKGGGRL